MARTPKQTPPPAKKPAGRNAKLKAMSTLVTKGFGRARDVLTPIKAVPTIFPQYDHAVRVGGHPLQRMVTVHGPSNHGKTAFVLGLGRAFLERGHYFAYIDAEHTMDHQWPASLGLGDHDKFLAMHPQTYEEAVDGTRTHCKAVQAERANDQNLTSLIVVDSISKLVPQAFFAKIAKGAEKVGIDGFGGRAGQMRAALNKAWLDELTPLLFHTHTTLVFITREAVDPDADANDKKFGNDYKVTGGGSLIYDAALRLRIERSGFIYGAGGEDGKKGPVYGERHRIAIHKTKVAGKTERVPVAYFHTSNGVLVPYGFDQARDLLEMGKNAGIVKPKGAWLQFGKYKWNGENQAVKALHVKPEALQDLDAAVRAEFDNLKTAEEEDTEDAA